ncbi:BTAD domain-containing putative transcriptional regulator [Catellatospora sp. KI3]|uniref:BTAD domain-containing putative transcriptional regulator n=1 Tax=Catellatospora sp. KI3 TaxID=3041620 RepID=UPI002482EEE1|nr:BTAD domain-containing putative transcriptional regulator [Catellatospora sp. KI3]MDI1463269.1 BTAD domain-containing putative transcriptional regulator [Catellatospora sp. KI3]
MADGGALQELARTLRQLKRRDARRRGGAELTYRALAARTGWSTGIIAHYFTGKTLPPTDRFDTLVRLLGASPAEQGKLATLRDLADEDRRQPAAPGTQVVRLLGPIEVTGPRGRAALVGGRQRTLLGVLGLRAGQPVSPNRLAEALWGDQPPRTATQSLYSHIARVRQALDDCGLPGVLVTRDSGYLLDLHPAQTDVARFHEHTDLGRRALAQGAAAQAATHLLDGLGLWRGTAFEDGEPAGWAVSEIERLAEARLSALDDLWDARLRLGEHATAADEIEQLLAADPGRERLVGLLMLALYRSGRHANAVRAYQRLREHLAEQLGVDPSPQLQRLHVAVLRRDPSLEFDGPTAADRPAQLPAAAGCFTGRAPEEAALDTMVDGTGRIAVISGPGGMGKTALAVHWARRVIDRYPDGQLFLDLRGHDPATAMPAAEAVAHLLRSLGVTADAAPHDLGRYRSALHERRMLILLDDAATAEQIAPLVPPDGNSLLVVTSRHQLTALALDHEVVAISLDTLPHADASLLLRRVLGHDRVDREPAHADRLVDLCGRLPLALRIAAAKLAARPLRPLAELVADLTGGDRLDTLTVPGDSRSVRAVFASAYQTLSPPAAALFRRLGHHPGPTFTAHLAAAVAGRPVAEALDELAAVHLVTEVADGRYRFHDLIRLYAVERCGPDEAQRARAATLTWYLALAETANQTLEPARDRVKLSWHSPPPNLPPLPDAATVLSLLDGERPNLLPVARHAAAHGEPQVTWQLTYLLASYYTHRGHWAAYAEICREGLTAALRLDDPVGERLMRSGLGVACNVTHRHEDALRQLTRALELMREGGDQRGQGMALNNIAHAHAQLGRLPDARDAFTQALDLHTADDHLPGITLALNNIADIHTQLGDFDLAHVALDRALRLARDLGSAHLEGAVLQNLGEARLAAGDEDGALHHFGLALAIRRRNGEKRREAETSNAIGLVHLSRGEHASALDHFGRALARCRELDDRGLEARTLANMSLLG